MGPSAFEVLMLDLVNEERVSRGLQPLAHDASLGAAAEDHSQWMNASGKFSHTGQGGSSHTQRMVAAGYDLEGSWGTAENIAWASLRGPAGYADEVALLHDNLMNSAGHRANILDADMREIGIGFETGPFQGTQGAMVTQVFGYSGSGVFLTGLTTQDLDGDGRYDIGEGRGGVTITATSGNGTYSTVSGAAGDYALALSAGTYEVTFSKAGMASVTRTVTIGSENVGLDLSTADEGGTRQTVSRDTADRYVWDTITRTYDADDALIEQERIDDDGDRFVFEYESGVLVARTAYDGSQSQRYDNTRAEYEGGTLVRRVTTDDSGDVRSYDYADGLLTTYGFTDASDRYAFASMERRYDANGRTVSRTVVEDDGDTRDYEYAGGRVASATFTDGSDTRSWLTSETLYDTRGGVDRRFITEDDGDTRGYDYVDGVLRQYVFEDVSDTRDWQTLTIDYDADGAVIDRTYVPDELV